jgi:hypothetical protein
MIRAGVALKALAALFRLALKGKGLRKSKISLQDIRGKAILTRSKGYESGKNYTLSAIHELVIVSISVCFLVFYANLAVWHGGCNR